MDSEESALEEIGLEGAEDDNERTTEE